MRLFDSLRQIFSRQSQEVRKPFRQKDLNLERLDILLYPLKSWFPQRRSGFSARTVRRPCFEVLEDRTMLAAQPLTLVIPHINSLGDFAAGPYEARVTIDNTEFVSSQVGSHGDSNNPFEQSIAFNQYETPDWVFPAIVDPVLDPTATVTIRLIDVDKGGFFGSGNDKLDINPIPGTFHLTLTVDLQTGDWTSLDGSVPLNQPFSLGDGDNDGHSPYSISFFFLSPQNANGDFDGDGLLNSWEVLGIDGDNDPATGVNGIDYKLPGANPLIKDLYVEIDAMQGRVPQIAALDDVVKAFGIAPVSNPDGRDGVRLHYELDETNIALASWVAQPTIWSGFDAIKQNLMPQNPANPATFGGFMTSAERGDPNAANIRLAKALAYRYCIFADQFIAAGASGIAEMPGNDFYVTLGTAAGGTREDQAATFMHELGHTLGLGHGGAIPPLVGTLNGDPTNPFLVTGINAADVFVGMTVAGVGIPVNTAVFGVNAAANQITLGQAATVNGPQTLFFSDNTNYKPNYHSIMNYTWQFRWNPAPGASQEEFDFRNSWELDYAQQAFPDLDEGKMNEQAGIGGHAGHTVGVIPIFNLGTLTGYQQFVNENGAVNWNGSRPPVEIDPVNPAVPMVVDVNNDGAIELLHGYSDWDRLVYNLRDNANYADGSHISVVSEEVPPGTITGFKWHDREPDGDYDASTEEKLEGWTIYVDLNNNGELDKYEEDLGLSQGTDPYYSFTLPPGVYTIRERPPENDPDAWTQTFPGNTLEAHVVQVYSGGMISANFGNAKLGEIRGQKKVDFNGDGIWDGGGAEIGWEVYLDIDGDGIHDDGEPITTTGDNGYYSFQVVKGTYIVAEKMRPGWKQAYPGGGGTHTVTVAPEIEALRIVSGVDFGNTKLPPTITGVVWNDRNGDGIRQLDEPVLTDRAVFLDENENGQWDRGEQITTTHFRDGTYQFPDLDIGVSDRPRIHCVRLAREAGWHYSNPANGLHRVILTPDNWFAERHFGIYQNENRVVGSDGDDTIVVREKGGQTVEVFINDQPVITGDLLALTIDAGGGKDHVDIQSIPSGLSLIVNTGDGDDIVSVAATALNSAVTIHGNGGKDQLTVNGSPGDETAKYWARSIDGKDAHSLQVVGPAYRVDADSFEIVHLHAGGGVDQAFLYDSASKDHFIATLGAAFLTDDKTFANLDANGLPTLASDYYVRTTGFKQVTAHGTPGGDDQAKLYDTPQHDIFLANPYYGNQPLNFALMAPQGPYPDTAPTTFYYRTFGFDKNEGVVTHTDRWNKAYLWDTKGNDTFTAGPGSALMTDATPSGVSSYANSAIGFEFNIGMAQHGGWDKAILHGLPNAAEIVLSEPGKAGLFDAATGGRNLYLYARWFEAVETILHDSAPETIAALAALEPAGATVNSAPIATPVVTALVLENARATLEHGEQAVAEKSAILAARQSEFDRANQSQLKYQTELARKQAVQASVAEATTAYKAALAQQRSNRDRTQRQQFNVRVQQAKAELNAAIKLLRIQTAATQKAASAMKRDTRVLKKASSALEQAKKEFDTATQERNQAALVVADVDLLWNQGQAGEIAR